jgi:hypothetical protein
MMNLQTTDNQFFIKKNVKILRGPKFPIFSEIKNTK